MGIKISEPVIDEEGGSISVSIDYAEGKKDCDHVWYKSLLLFVKTCDKCGRIEPLEDEDSK